MKREKICFKVLLMVLVSFLFNTCSGDGKSSDQSSTTAPGSYKTQEIYAGLEYTIKYKRPAKGDQVEMAYEFFELNKDLFQIKNPREEFVMTYRNDRVVAFQQTYQGIGLPSGIKVRFSRDGEVTSVEGSYIYDINLPSIPSIDSATAVKIALQDMGNPPHPKVVGPGKPIFAAANANLPLRPQGMHLVYIMEIFPDSVKSYPYFWKYYIDALDGGILYKAQESKWRD